MLSSVKHFSLLLKTSLVGSNNIRPSDRFVQPEGNAVRSRLISTSTEARFAPGSDPRTINNAENNFNFRKTTVSSGNTAFTRALERRQKNIFLSRVRQSQAGGNIFQPTEAPTRRNNSKILARTITNSGNSRRKQPSQSSSNGGGQSQLEQIFGQLASGTNPGLQGQTNFVNQNQFLTPNQNSNFRGSNTGSFGQGTVISPGTNQFGQGSGGSPFIRRPFSSVPDSQAGFLSGQSPTSNINPFQVNSQAGANNAAFAGRFVQTPNSNQQAGNSASFVPGTALLGNGQVPFVLSPNSGTARTQINSGFPNQRAGLVPNQQLFSGQASNAGFLTGPNPGLTTGQQNSGGGFIPGTALLPGSSGGQSSFVAAPQGSSNFPTAPNPQPNSAASSGTFVPGTGLLPGANQPFAGGATAGTGLLPGANQPFAGGSTGGSSFAASPNSGLVPNQQPNSGTFLPGTGLLPGASGPVTPFPGQNSGGFSGLNSGFQQPNPNPATFLPGSALLPGSNTGTVNGFGQPTGQLVPGQGFNPSSGFVSPGNTATGFVQPGGNNFAGNSGFIPGGGNFPPNLNGQSPFGAGFPVGVNQGGAGSDSSSGSGFGSGNAPEPPPELIGGVIPKINLPTLPPAEQNVSNLDFTYIIQIL